MAKLDEVKEFISYLVNPEKPNKFSQKEPFENSVFICVLSKCFKS